MPRELSNKLTSMLRHRPDVTARPAAGRRSLTKIFSWALFESQGVRAFKKKKKVQSGPDGLPKKMHTTAEGAHRAVGQK